MHKKLKNKGHGSTFLKHVFNTGRDKGQATNYDQNTSLAEELTDSTEKGTNKRLRSNSDRRVKYTTEGSKTSQTHQRVDVLNTDHKDVAVFRESSRIFTHPKKVLQQTQRCFSSAFHFGFQLVTRSRKPTLRNGYVWVMIPQVTLGSSAFLTDPTAIQHRDQRGSTSNFWMIHQYRHHHGKQLENLVRLLGSSPEPRVLHPSGRERRHLCLLQDVRSILFTRSSSVLFLNA